MARHLTLIRGKTQLPIGVGFGIHDGATARKIADIADAVVVGSRLLLEMETAAEQNLLTSVAALTSELRHAIDADRTKESI